MFCIPSGSRYHHTPHGVWETLIDIGSKILIITFQRNRDSVPNFFQIFIFLFSWIERFSLKIKCYHKMKYIAIDWCHVRKSKTTTTLQQQYSDNFLSYSWRAMLICPYLSQRNQIYHYPYLPLPSATVTRQTCVDWRLYHGQW